MESSKCFFRGSIRKTPRSKLVWILGLPSPLWLSRQQDGGMMFPNIGWLRQLRLEGLSCDFSMGFIGILGYTGLNFIKHMFQMRPCFQ